MIISVEFDALENKQDGEWLQLPLKSTQFAESRLVHLS